MKTGECYLCGEIKELTDDHVPPKSLFPQPITEKYQLITVKACFDCNNSWGEKEKKLIHDLTIVGESKDAQKVFESNTRENYMKGFWKRGGPSKDYFNIISRMKRTNLKTDSGIILPKKVTIFNIPKDRDEVLVKIGKGLHRKFKGKRLSTKIFSNVIMRVPLIQDNFFDLYKACSVKRTFGETFTFAGGFPTDNENVSFWFLGFYTNMDFLVLLSDIPLPERK